MNAFHGTFFFRINNRILKCNRDLRTCCSWCKWSAFPFIKFKFAIWFDFFLLTSSRYRRRGTRITRLKSLLITSHDFIQYHNVWSFCSRIHMLSLDVHWIDVWESGPMRPFSILLHRFLSKYTYLCSSIWMRIKAAQFVAILKIQLFLDLRCIHVGTPSIVNAMIVMQMHNILKKSWWIGRKAQSRRKKKLNKIPKCVFLRTLRTLNSHMSRFLCARTTQHAEIKTVHGSNIQNVDKINSSVSR